jgi:hypothetical protein
MNRKRPTMKATRVSLSPRDGLGAVKPHLVAGIMAARSRWAILLAVLAAPALAKAADANVDDGVPRLGMDPGEPQAPSPPPSIPFGVRPAESKEYVLDFHGYLLLPAYLGLHERENPLPGQSSLVLHSPPLVPQDLHTFDYTGVVPNPWLQLNFIYGNSTVSATVILAGTSAIDAAGFYNPVDQMGVNDAYLTINLTKWFKIPFQLNVGALTGRYGAMGSYDAGRYGTPLIAQTNTIGETVTTGLMLGSDFFLMLEQGLGGQMGRPPVGLVPAGWNDFADPNVGATFVNHVHLGLAYRRLARLGFHYLTAWTQDDLAGGGTGLVPDGRITVMGGDLSLTMGRGGHLYLGGSHVWATNAATVSGAIEVLNARGGDELISNYLGTASGGNGGLTIFGGQYDISLARLVFGQWYTGVTPDVLISVFGVGASVSSADPTANGVLKLKGGVEATYTFLSWMGVSERFDHVRLTYSDSKNAFTSLSTRLLFHTGWRARNEIALQYAYFIYGSSIDALTGYPPVTPVNPDRQVFSLTGTIWW